MTNCWLCSSFRGELHGLPLSCSFESRLLPDLILGWVGRGSWTSIAGIIKMKACRRVGYPSLTEFYYNYNTMSYVPWSQPACSMVRTMLSIGKFSASCRPKNKQKMKYEPADKQPHAHTHKCGTLTPKTGEGGNAVVLNPCIWAKSQTDFPQQIHTCHKRALGSNNTLRSTPFD